MSKRTLYMRTTKDEYELPVAVADTASELARMLGVTQASVSSCISKHYKGWAVVIVEDDDL